MKESSSSAMPEPRILLVENLNFIVLYWIVTGMAVSANPLLSKDKQKSEKIIALIRYNILLF